MLNLKCQIFSKKFNFLNMRPDIDRGPIYSILSLDTTKGVFGTYTQGLFKFEIQMVDMDQNEINNKKLNQKSGVRRGSISRINHDQIAKIGSTMESLVKKASQKSLETEEQINEQKRLNKKYKHVGEDILSAKKEGKNQLIFIEEYLILTKLISYSQWVTWII